MKIWIMLIFKLSGKIEKLTERIDAKVEKTALNPFGDTAKQYEDILRLSDRKVKLINLKLMYDELKKMLTGEEFFLIAGYSDGYSLSMLGEQMNKKKQTVYNRLNKAFKNAARILETLGFTEERLNKDYAEESGFTGVYKRLKNKAPKENNILCGAKKASSQAEAYRQI